MISVSTEGTAKSRPMINNNFELFHHILSNQYRFQPKLQQRAVLGLIMSDIVSSSVFKLCQYCITIHQCTGGVVCILLFYSFTHQDHTFPEARNREGTERESSLVRNWNLSNRDGSSTSVSMFSMSTSTTC